MLPVFSPTFWICIAAPSLVLALPQLSATSPTSASTTSLPASLSTLIPSCAHDCVESFLINEFTLSCATSGDLDCLCSQYSSAGLSLGEVAWECAFSSCPSTTPNLTSTYDICSGESEAVSPTHSVLTFTGVVSRTTSTTITSIHSTTTRSSQVSSAQATTTDGSSVSSAFDRTTSVSSDQTTTASSDQTTTVSSDQTTSVSSDQPTAAATGSPSSSLQPTSTGASDSSSPSREPLSTSQIVGVTVSGVSAVILAAGVLFLLACLRRRDRKKQKLRQRQIKSFWDPADPFGGGEPTDKSWTPPTQSLRDPRRGAGGAGIGIAHSQWPPARKLDAFTQKPKPRPVTPPTRPPRPDEIGLAISPDTPVGSSASFESERTVSKLLPDKPNPAHVRDGPASDPPVMRESSATQFTVFEEDTAVRRSLHPVRAVQLPLPLPLPPAIPPRSAQRSLNSGSVQTGGRNMRTPQQPALSLHIPYEGASPPPYPLPLQPRPKTPSPKRGAETQSVTSQPHQPSTSASNRTGIAVPVDPSSSTDDIFDYYTHDSISPHSIQRTPPTVYTGTPAASTPTLPHPPILSHAHSSTSSSSVTEFEPFSPDDITPPTDAEDAHNPHKSTTTSNKHRSTGIPKPLAPGPESANTTTQANAIAQPQLQGDTSPIHKLRYPKVPRASNQAVARVVPRPSLKQQQQQQQQQQNLLARRRGDDKALAIGQGLCISASPDSSAAASQNESADRASPASRGRPRERGSERESRASSDGGEVGAGREGAGGAAGLLVSPSWGPPRLTPTRRGLDLVLSVTYGGR